MLKNLLLFTCLSFCGNSVSAQLTTAQKAELHLISRDYAFNSNEYFIIADLLEDGLLKTGEPYTANYNRTELVVNGQMLQEPFCSKYNKKIAEHFERLGVPMEYRTLNFNGDLLNMQVLYAHNYRRHMPFNTTFTPQQYAEPVCPTGVSLKMIEAFEKEYKISHKNDRVLLHELVKNNIVKKAADIHIRYNKNQCWVNGVEIKENGSYYASLAQKTNQIQQPKDDEYYGINYDAYEVKRFGFCDEE